MKKFTITSADAEKVGFSAEYCESENLYFDFEEALGLGCEFILTTGGNPFTNEDAFNREDNELVEMIEKYIEDNKSDAEDCDVSDYEYVYDWIDAWGIAPQQSPMKWYFVRTNAFDEIIADDGRFRYVYTDTYIHADGEEKDEIIANALSILKRVAADYDFTSAGWEKFSEEAYELIDSTSEILAEYIGD